MDSLCSELEGPALEYLLVLSVLIPRLDHGSGDEETELRKVRDVQRLYDRGGDIHLKIFGDSSLGRMEMGEESVRRELRTSRMEGRTSRVSSPLYIFFHSSSSGSTPSLQQTRFSPVDSSQSIVSLIC